MLRLKKYGIWFLVNFGVCLLPFFIMIMANKSTTQIYSGFLAYNFTLLISGLYLLTSLIYGKDNSYKSETAEAIHWLSATWVFLILILFIFYPDIPSKTVAVLFSDKYLPWNSLVIILVTLTLALFLNNPIIQKAINDAEVKQKEKGLKKIADRVVEMGKTLKEETE